MTINDNKDIVINNLATLSPSSGDLPDGSCDECRRADISRRRFLAGMAAATGGLAVTSVFGEAFRQVTYAAAKGNNVLVVLSLRGGADGLSMVVPHADADYYSLRPGIGIPKASLIAQDAQFGLHPGFKPLEEMWSAKSFGVAHAVGLPQPNRSHFDAMEAIEDADPGSPARSGWINRMIGLDSDSDPVEGVQLGSTMVPTELYGGAPVIAVSRLSDLKLPGEDNEKEKRPALERLWKHAKGPLGQGTRVALSTTARLSPISKLQPKPENGANYPGGNLGDVLLSTATLIKADVGARVVTIDYGNWDMHVGLGRVDGGWMHNQVTELASALAAFFKDLGTNNASRVTLVTISEFGRRVQENGDGGLDHGYGNCMLMLGAGVKGGQVHVNSGNGGWPHVQSSSLVDGDLKVTGDYRSVLAEVLKSRFNDADASKVFPGFKPETIGTMG
jgi:uncharacterized protein (DUF1501 family)